MCVVCIICRVYGNMVSIIKWGDKDGGKLATKFPSSGNGVSPVN